MLFYSKINFFELKKATFEKGFVFKSVNKNAKSWLLAFVKLKSYIYYMKNWNLTHSKISLLILVVFISGCNLSKDYLSARLIKKRYSNGYYIDFGSTVHGVSKSGEKKNKSEKTGVVNALIDNPTSDSASIAADTTKEDRVPALVEAPREDTKVQTEVQPQASFAAPVCDTLELKSGKMIKVKISTIGPDKVKYRMCNDPNGIELYYYSQEVFQVRKGNGEKLVFSKLYSEQEMRQGAPQPNKKYDPFGIASFIFGLLSWTVFLAPVALILGFISIKRIRRNPERYEGEWMTWAGIGLGLLAAIIYLGLFISIGVL